MRSPADEIRWWSWAGFAAGLDVWLGIGGDTIIYPAGTLLVAVVVTLAARSTRRVGGQPRTSGPYPDGTSSG